MRRLEHGAEQLARAMRRLEHGAERLARAMRREQPLRMGRL
jgi:hypothetical protein